ncbi:RagB/SusD family nutrient uptake outer membrane protein [Sphingobacterium cavernae]|uniref:RagB/SusD family nutrient uptake outer membrane protein n=1 Tax=Sphingobacterium cavernae TaxID=2592657 RepID=UPI00122FF321|nr:RagB/SusD family nutrient uptake outer membrane protein [Sphingobacterium cavernae]
MKFKYILSALALSASLASCDIEKFPYDSISQEMAFQSVSDAEKWNNNFYAQLRGRIYGVYTLPQDIQSDMLNATADFGNNYGAVHRWAEEFNSDNYQVRDVWVGYYGALKNINESIAKFPTINAVTDADKAKLNQYLGDAYAIRAYYYLNLVLRYSKAYNANTAATDLGVPLVLTFDLKESPKRASVKETYDQILSDINQSKTLLANVNGSVGATKFTIDAVYALEARVKLYMNDLPGAAEAAEKVIKTDKYKLYTTAEDVKSIWATDKTQETIFQLFASLNERPNTNDSYYNYEASTDTYRSYFIPSKWVLDMYDAIDFRKNAYFKEVDLYQQGKKYKAFIVNKYPGNPTLVSSKAENHNAPKVFRVAELYLISAEANATVNSTLALTRLNALREARGLARLNNLSGAALLTEIKNERLRELAFEGFRLDDLKRWNEGFERRSPQGTDFLQTGSGYINLKKEKGDEKFVWGIPSYDITLNSNLEQNKGW